jgi:chaperone required for assembly of F1-ATPase
MADPDRDRSNTGEPTAPVDPIEMARRDLKRALPRRFFAEVATGPLAGGGFGVLLDGKPVRTPAKALLAVPTAALAEALAEEWRAQGEIIDPAAMPITRLVNSAIDGVAGAVEPTIGEIARFADTDLVCYRAADPAALVAAQARAWDPVLAFARRDLGAAFTCAEGVMYVSQSETALRAVRTAVEAVANGPGGPVRLAALHVLTSIAGSVLIALALTRGVLTGAEAWSAAHIDEDFQADIWGADSEAMQRRANHQRDFEAATRVLALAGAE